MTRPQHRALAGIAQLPRFLPLIGSSAILLLHVCRQPQVPVFFNRQRGVFERRRRVRP